ncbi:hypothetical protein E2C01_057246 [Portunus trituberculatus]|uniref:Uncharacterized protein n=1 Tax=Portunus trituberculatus TaxID=210409 RepID=A0A5B7GWA1_PORTR|nr:hypothetical protein [Portunus trituberculatus]
MRTGNHQPSWPTIPQILSAKIDRNTEGRKEGNLLLCKYIWVKGGKGGHTLPRASLENPVQTLNFSKENTGRNSPNLMCVHFQKARLLQDTHIGPPNYLTNSIIQGMRVNSSSGIQNCDQQPKAGRPTISSPAKILTDRPNWTKKTVYLILPNKIKKSKNCEFVK